MVCSYLKLKRRALWDIRRDPAKAFPAAVKPGGKVNLFRAEDVRQWVAKRRPTSLPPPQSATPPAPAIPMVAKKPEPIVERTAAAPELIRKAPQRKRSLASDERQLGLF
jgi:predicted DNA-binding transcriptional regulator AlpA